MYCFGPVCQGVEDTLFCRDVVVAVPVQILICVGGFSVDYSAEGVVWLDGDESVQEGE